MAELQIGLTLTAEDMLSPAVNRSLRAVQQLQRGVQALNGATAQAGPQGGLNQLGQQAQQAQRQVGGLSDAVSQLVGTLVGGVGGPGGASLAAALRAGTIAGAVLAVGTGVAALASRSRDLRVQMQQAQNALGAFADSGRDVDLMLQDARQNAMLTGRSFEEVIAAQASLGSVARSPSQMRQMLELAERLAVLAPEQGVQGAAFAIREANANQFESAVDRMNLSRATINRLLAEGVRGTDVLSKALDEMGVSMDDVSKQGEGLEGQTNRLTNAMDGLLVRVTSPAWKAYEDQLKAINAQLTGPGGQPTPAQVGGNALADIAGQILGATVAQAGLQLDRFLGLIGRGLTDYANLRDYFARVQQGGYPGSPEARATATAAGLLRARAVRGDEFSRIVPQREPDIFRTITGTLPSQALDQYARRMDDLTHMDDALREHAKSWNSVTTRITDATNQVDAFQRQLERLQQAEGFAGGLRGELQRARALERRMGTYGGEYDAAIRDLYRREHGYTLDEGEAALQAYLAAREREARGGEFAADRVRVDEQHVEATNVYVNGGAVNGAAQPSGISGSGLPAGGPPRGRYAQAQSAWPWWIPGPGAPGIGRALG